MKGMLAVLLLIGLAGIPVYRTMTSSEFGLSDEHPLGDFSVIEDWLLQRGFERTEGEFDFSSYTDSPPEIQGAQIFHYKEVKKSRQDNVNYQVTLIKDAGGVLRGVGAGFFSGSKNTSVATSRSEYLAQNLWIEITGSEPGFTEIVVGQGRFARQALVAYLDQGAVKGRWRKSFLSSGEVRSLFDHFMVYSN